MRLTYTQWVTKVAEELQRYFFLHPWSIILRKIDKPKKDLKDAIADVETNHEYMFMTINLFPIAKRMFDDGKLEKLGQTLVHEFCHVLTDPLYKMVIDAAGGKGTPLEMKNLERIREHSTQMTALAVWNGIPKKIFSPYVKEP